jgi:hypothetical protein
LNARSGTAPIAVEPATIDDAPALSTGDAPEGDGQRVVAVDFRNRRRAA